MTRAMSSPRLAGFAALLSVLSSARLMAEVSLTSANPSWTAFSTSGIGVAYVDIRLKPGTLPINASFAVETESSSPAFSVSTTRLSLGRTGTARLVVRSSGATQILVRLRELTRGAQTLETSVRFYGPLSVNPSTNRITLDDTLLLSVTGGIPPYTLTATPSDILYFRPDGSAVPQGTRGGPVTISVTDSRKKRVSAPTTLVRLPTKPSVDASKWSIPYAVGMPLRPSSLTNSAGWSFDFPKPPIGRVGYITQDVSSTYLRASALQARFSVISDPGVVFDHHTEPQNTSDFPAHVRLYLQKGNISNEANTRWWSNPIAIQITPGNAVLRVPLEPSQWSNLYGVRGDADTATSAAFREVLENLSEIGFTMGGGFFYGHGVRVIGGNARFILTGFEAIP